jgi:hypothetical protein
MPNSNIEELADEYCAEHGIDLHDPVRGQVIAAFCIGASVEREECAKIADEFNTFPYSLSAVGHAIASGIRNK